MSPGTFLCAIRSWTPVLWEFFSHSKHSQNDVKLPLPILSHVLSFCSAKDLVRISLVSKRWKCLANDEKLWERLYQSQFGSENKSVIRTWKDAYIAKDMWLKFSKQLHVIFGDRESIWSIYQRLSPDQKENLPLSVAKILYGSLYTANAKGVPTKISNQEFNKTFNNEIKQLTLRLKVLTRVDLSQGVSFQEHLNYYYEDAKSENEKSDEERRSDLLDSCILAFENHQLEEI